MHPGINCCPEPPESCRALLAVPSSAGVAAPTQLALNQCPRSRGWGGASQPLSSPHGLTPPSPGAAAPPASAALTEVLRDVQVVPEAQAGVGGSREGLALQPGTGAPQAQHTGVKVHVVTWKGRDRARGVPWFRSPPPASCHPPANGQGPPSPAPRCLWGRPRRGGDRDAAEPPPRTYWGCSQVSPPLPSFACSLRPCQGARGGGCPYRPSCPGCDPAQGRGTGPGRPRSSSPRRSCAGGGPRGCSSRTCPARSRRTLGGEGGAVTYPAPQAPTALRCLREDRASRAGAAAATSSPAPPAGGQAKLRAGAGRLVGTAEPRRMGRAVPIPTAVCPHRVPRSHPAGCTAPPWRGLSPGSGQGPSDTCRSSSAMYPWAPPAPTASNITCRGGGQGGTLGLAAARSPCAAPRGAPHPALSHLPVPIGLDGDVAAVPGVPLHGADTHHLPPHPALLHKDPERACPGHPPLRGGPRLRRAGPSPCRRCPPGVSRCSPGLLALSWNQKERHWEGAEGWKGWEVRAATCPHGREPLPVLTTM